jgi:hypothetical protein
LNNGNISPVAIHTGLTDGVKMEVKNEVLTAQSEIVTGIKVNGTVAPQSKGLIQAPKRGPNVH